MCHENYPTLILKTRPLRMQRGQGGTSAIGPQNATSSIDDTAKKALSAAGIAYREFERYGRIESLEQAIMHCQTARDLLSQNHPALPGILSNLGLCLRSRFERLGKLEDINASIAQHQTAVNLTPDGDSDKPSHLSNLGISFEARFRRLGNLADLNEAITYKQAGVDLLPDGHPHKPISLNNLGGSLQTRFQRFGNTADIDNAITSKQIAIRLTPDGHPQKPGFLNNLGNSLQFRFQRSGNLADLDKAVESNQAAINLTPNDHPEKPILLNSLGTALMTRFERLGNIADINNAVKASQAAVDLAPNDFPNKSLFLNNLALTLRQRFERLGEPADINDAITSAQSSVDLTQDNHPNKALYLNNLGISLETRFQRLGNLADIDKAIESSQSAVALLPTGHPAKPGYLSNLGNSLQRRFQRFENPADINEAITSKQAAVDLTPEDHLDRSGCLINLGDAFNIRFTHFHRPEDAEAAISNLSAAASSPLCPPINRFKTAQVWISLATRTSHPSLLSAYDCAVTSMPLVAWLGLPISDRHQHLIEIGGITREAAAAAISLEQYDKALEWLEHGRSIVWTQILQLRTPLDQLRVVKPDLAERLVQVSRLLDQGPEQGIPSGGDGQFAEEAGRRYRALTMERESMIDQVRALPNFENFLRPLDSLQLMNAAQDGPVVVFNIAKQRCDALALLPGLEEVIHIPLPDVSSKQVTQLAGELKALLSESGIRRRGERAAKKVEDETDEDGCKHILAELWNNLVKPVLDLLALSVCFHFALRLQLLMTPSSLNLTSFLVSGGAPPALSHSFQYMRLVYTILA
jgi:tetratricopeptide (TPR) repeat protein